jgi:hypothetical protein
MRLQWRWLRLLAQQSKNIDCVGGWTVLTALPFGRFVGARGALPGRAMGRALVAKYGRGS